MGRIEYDFWGMAFWIRMGGNFRSSCRQIVDLCQGPMIPSEGHGEHPKP